MRAALWLVAWTGTGALAFARVVVAKAQAAKRGGTNHWRKTSRRELAKHGVKTVAVSRLSSLDDEIGCDDLLMSWYANHITSCISRLYLCTIVMLDFLWWFCTIYGDFVFSGTCAGRILFVQTACICVAGLFTCDYVYRLAMTANLLLSRSLRQVLSRSKEMCLIQVSLDLFLLSEFLNSLVWNLFQSQMFSLVCCEHVLLRLVIGWSVMSYGLSCVCFLLSSTSDLWEETFGFSFALTRSPSDIEVPNEKLKSWCCWTEVVFFFEIWLHIHVNAFTIKWSIPLRRCQSKQMFEYMSCSLVLVPLQF
jgi:hypothetical protein